MPVGWLVRVRLEFERGSERGEGCWFRLARRGESWRLTSLRLLLRLKRRHSKRFVAAHRPHLPQWVAPALR